MSCEEIVESWMTTALRNGGIDNFDDLHIDRIDTTWKKRTRWIEGGLQSFAIATAIRDNAQLRVDIALAFSLVSGEASHGVDFKTPIELGERLDWSPPSLYLLHPGKMPWDRNAPATGSPIHITPKQIDPSVLGAPQTEKGCWYIEFKQPASAEYSRTLFLIG